MDCSVAQAVKMFNSRGFGREACGKLAGQLLLYNAGMRPFNRAFGDPSAFSVTALWAVVDETFKELRTLALYLHRLGCHASSTERVGGMLGWYHETRTSELAVPAWKVMRAIRDHPKVKQHVPRYVIKHCT